MTYGRVKKVWQSPSLIFLRPYVWMYSIRSRSRGNMRLRCEWVNLYVTTSRVGSSFDGKPGLICLWLQRGLWHASCPCSALINGSGESEEGEEVGVRPRQRLWGFSRLNYIQSQSPADTHTHILHLINMDTHTYPSSLVWGNTNFFHTGWFVDIKQHSDEVGSFFRFRLQRKECLRTLQLRRPAESAVCLHCNMMC